MNSIDTKTVTTAAIGVALGLILGYVSWGGQEDAGHTMQTTNTTSSMSTMNHSMDDMMMDMTANMKGKTGDDLDHTFLDDMITHHQGAVDMAKLLKEGTVRPELKKFADDIITAQTGEITQMKEWNTEWFGMHSH